MAELSTLGSVIKTAYEGEADTNAFTDAEKSKLAGIAAGAEVNTVDSVNSLTGAVVLDPDDLDDTSTTNKFTTAAEISKLAGIEALADVTDEANVVAALSGASLAAIGTPASSDKVLIQDTSDSDNLKFASFSEFAGGGGVTWSDPVDADIIPDADGTRDLGSSAIRFAVLHVDQIDLAGVALDGSSIPLTDCFEFVIDGGGSAITTGEKGHLEVPFDCTITAVTMLADQSGSIVIDVWKDTYANYPPTNADSITASATPTISSAVKSQDTTLTGWTTSLTAGDILAFNVDSVTNITRVTISLKVAL